MAYAHALIELPDGSRIQRGAEVPSDIDGYDALVEAGAVQEAEYDPADEPVLAPETIEIDGVKYVRAADGAQEDSDAA